MSFLNFILEIMPYVVDLAWVAVAVYTIRRIFDGGVEVTLNPKKAPPKAPAARKAPAKK